MVRHDYFRAAEKDAFCLGQKDTNHVWCSKDVSQVKTSPSTKRCCCHTAQGLRHIGGGGEGVSEKQGEERKGNSPSTVSNGQTQVTTTATQTLGICLTEKKKWVGVRDSRPDSRMGKKGQSKREGSIYGATSQGLAWDVPFFVEGAERRHLWAEWSRAESLVCRLVAQERNPVDWCIQMVGASRLSKPG